MAPRIIDSSPKEEFMAERERIVVFYSWQSDSPPETNRDAIRFALREAANGIEGQTQTTIVIDEATRNVPGAPDISSTILEKIAGCDVFIADCTTTHPAEKNERLRNPNPNVLFELGNAVARIGWDRIIILFNVAESDLKDLPFDIATRRVSTYKLHKASASKKKADSVLANLLKTAITQITTANPPTQMAHPSLEEVKHSRDLAQLRLVFTAIHTEVLDAMYATLPTGFHYPALFFNERLNHIMTKTSFHLYDEVAQVALVKVLTAWNTCIDSEKFQCQITNTDYYKLSKHDIDDAQVTDAIWKGVADLKTAVSQLLLHVRTSFVEIDLESTNAEAWKIFRSSLSSR